MKLSYTLRLRLPSITWLVLISSKYWLEYHYRIEKKKNLCSDIEFTSMVLLRCLGRSIELPSLAVIYKYVDIAKPLPEKKFKYLLYSIRERASNGE